MIGFNDFSGTAHSDVGGWKPAELEGYPVWVTRYPFGIGYITEIGCLESGDLVARGSGVTADESLALARELAVHRLRRLHTCDLTVGG